MVLKHRLWIIKMDPITRITVKTAPSQNGPHLVKTAPQIGQNGPTSQNEGQKGPKSKRSLFFFFFFFVNA